MDEHDENQDEKVSVVFYSDAVVEPDAVVVKFLAASIAPPTVLRVLQHMRIAKLAEVVVLILVEFLVREPTVPLLADCTISGVYQRSDVADHNH